MFYTARVCFVRWVGLHKEYIHTHNAKFLEEVLESCTTHAHSRIHEKSAPTPHIPSNTSTTGLGSSTGHTVSDTLFTIKKIRANIG